ncbi:hypothetical protein [Methylobacterium dankookense]|uniref:Uncharacterized protein n=1 Tax=Methylobacterium dankookense TaxID=560405 RepID=A0A564G829_9HYPH|nr:hypothetical protein [Methylobacterium dankookense]GJD57013.1 hypothetical protein IFDJLNFL_2913 [Methylobacterium dankookense]VUF16134.1 hypothetical protein MTDSW087_05891 [Methylobacterium dankookense]
MILDAQHDRSASPLATVPDETHTTPNATRPLPAGLRQDTTPPAEAEAAPQESPPTNTFEAFGSFS